jgi:sugar-specific transcriptional regulator TrmB
MEEINKVLESLGLTEKETKVYLAMLMAGEETASRISEIASLNRITAYMILKSLKEKGFCSIYEKNKVQYFKPTKPENVLGLLDEKKEKFNAIIPLLKHQEKQIQEKPEISLFEGKQGIASLMSILLDDAAKKKEVLGYGNVSISEKVIQYQSIYWRKTRLEKKNKNEGGF